MNIKHSKILLLLLAFAVSCEKHVLMEESLTSADQTLLLKSMLEERDTRWTVDDLAIPQKGNDGWFSVTSDKELAFLLEFGSTSGEKYRLADDIDVSQSPIKDKISSETGVEKFENFEFDGNGKTLSGLDLPWAAGLFSRVDNATIHNLTLSGCTIGSESNVSNLLGTGAVIGSATGEVTVSDVTVDGCAVSAPCKVGGFVGAVADGTIKFTRCNVVGTDVKTLYFKGVSGWCGGFAGFVGRKEEKNTGSSLSVTMETCSVSGGKVQVHMESDTRYSGKFLGTLSGFDHNEVVRMNDCTVSVTFEGQDDKAAAAASEYHKDGYVGGHKYMNGYIYIDGLSYVTPWDGTTKTQPALVNGAYMVYTAAELAWFQGRTETTNKILIRRDIDLGGHLFVPIYKASHVDGQKVDGKNAEILNLKIVRENCGKEDGGAFIKHATNTTVHKNLTFRNVDIRATHDPNAIETAGGNAYCATLCGNLTGTYTAENIHAHNGRLYGVNKMGGLLGRVCAEANISNCSVNDYYIENYSVPEAPENFGTSNIEIIFYPEGEVGGMIGFIQKNVTISNCTVTNTEINATGQKDKWMLIATVPGRHVGAVIGDIRTDSGSTAYTITINNTSADSATFTKSSAHHLDQYSTKAKFIGSCYYVFTNSGKKGTVIVDGITVY